MHPLATVLQKTLEISHVWRSRESAYTPSYVLILPSRVLTLQWRTFSSAIAQTNTSDQDLELDTEPWIRNGLDEETWTLVSSSLNPVIAANDLHKTHSTFGSKLLMQRFAPHNSARVL